MGPATRHAPFRTALAFACVYLIWGTTYLAIRFAVETMPPLLMVGVRFLIAGAILYAWVAARGETVRPTARQWLGASLLGALFFLGGNGGVTVAETRVPSALAALVVASIPAWIVLIDWIRPRGVRPNGLTAIGLISGFAGVWILIGGGARTPGARIDPAGAAFLLAAAAAWGAGSVLTRYVSHVRSHLQSGAMQMLAGGAIVTLVGLAAGEGARIHPAAISTRSALSLAYLIVAGSIVAFSAYNWLLHVTTPARAGTYAYVNPAIAVLAGWSLGGEAVGPHVLIAGAVITTGVVLIISARSRPRAAGSAPAAAAGANETGRTREGPPRTAS
ncbi:MAG TPA: EamA family transporter [Candidatus Eisenbacteria bacterium]